MNIHHFSKKTFIVSICIVVVIPVFYIGYYPFCRFSMIETDYGYDSTNELILGLEQRTKKYWKMMFFKKGMSFHFTCHNGEKADITLGWDDSLHIKYGEVRRGMLVNQMYETRIDNGVYIQCEDFIIDVRPPDKDSIVGGVGFMDNANNYVSIYKQSEALPYGGQKYGLMMFLNGQKISSGNKNCFDY